jgi:hypothetical protein
VKLNSPLRRTATVLAGALIGLTGLTVAASPASAHDSKVRGSAVCDTATGTRVVTWTLTNDYPADATVSKLKSTPTDLEKADGDPVIPKAEDHHDGVLVLTQKVPGDAKEATISFTSLWSVDGYTDGDNSARVELSEPCAPVETPCVDGAAATFHHTFAVTEEGSTAKVTLDDGIKLCNEEPVTLVSYFAPKPQFSFPQYKFDSATGTISNEKRSVDLTVDVPKCNTQVDLFFGGENDILPEITENPKTRYGDLKLGSNSGKGARSKGPQGWFNGGSKTCQTPKVEPLSQCDGTVAINLSNDGLTDKYPIEFTVKAGEFSKTVTVTKGKGETVIVPAGSGSITVSAPGMKDEYSDWTPPADCELPSVVVENDCKNVTVTVTNPEGVQEATARVTYGDDVKDVVVAPGKTEKISFKRGDDKFATIEFLGLDVEPIKATLGEVDCDNGGEGGGNGGGGDTDEPGLPVTGPVAGSIAGVAVLLLIAGGVFFVIARRRKVTFTA